MRAFCPDRASRARGLRVHADANRHADTDANVHPCTHTYDPAITDAHEIPDRYGDAHATSHPGTIEDSPIILAHTYSHAPVRRAA